MKKLFTIIAAISALVSCTERDNGFSALNRQAAEEYLEPVRLGEDAPNPFWNEYSNKFIYAPAFDFPEVEETDHYLFTIEDCGSSMREADRYYHTLTEDPEPRWIFNEGQPTGREWKFVASSPKADLSPVWGQIPPCVVNLRVEAIDANGKVISCCGERRFLRDFPFEGPYTGKVRPYRKAAIMALHFIHEQPAIRSWLTSTEPDMSYRHNTYACKIIGSTISMECLIAKMIPSLRDEAETIARNAASFLMEESHEAGHVLAHFPPTYYKELISSSRAENKGKTMTMEACTVGNALLDLYDLTGDKIYCEKAVAIAETYASLQASDGSFPIKLDYETGEAVNGCKAMLTPVILFFERLEKSYGHSQFHLNKEAAENWMNSVAMASFDMTGQFEDMTVLNQNPYKNLTECASAIYASYLLSKTNKTQEDEKNARDLIRFSEDQFVYWNEFTNEYGYTCMNTPCVVEQYGYRVPIDHSSALMINAFLDYYQITGDKLSLEKARALADNLTVVQNALDGQIPTSLDMREGVKNKIRGYWVNCTYVTVKALLRMAEITGEQP